MFIKLRMSLTHDDRRSDGGGNVSRYGLSYVPHQPPPNSYVEIPTSRTSEDDCIKAVTKLK